MKIRTCLKVRLLLGRTSSAALDGVAQRDRSRNAFYVSAEEVPWVMRTQFVSDAAQQGMLGTSLRWLRIGACKSRLLQPRGILLPFSPTKKEIVFPASGNSECLCSFLEGKISMCYLLCAQKMTFFSHLPSEFVWQKSPGYTMPLRNSSCCVCGWAENGTSLLPLQLNHVSFCRDIYFLSFTLQAIFTKAEPHN